jgi:hypothetical protein
MKTIFCEVCHKPIKMPINTSKGSAINITVKCRDGHPNKIDIKGEKNMANPIDPNAGKRAALTAQIKAWTGVAAQMQGQLDNWNKRIAAAQAELNALPPAPVTPPTPPAAAAKTK